MNCVHESDCMRKLGNNDFFGIIVCLCVCADNDYNDSYRRKRDQMKALSNKQDQKRNIKCVHVNKEVEGKRWATISVTNMLLIYVFEIVVSFWAKSVQKKKKYIRTQSKWKIWPSKKRAINALVEFLFSLWLNLRYVCWVFFL